MQILIFDKKNKKQTKIGIAYDFCKSVIFDSKIDK